MVHRSMKIDLESIDLETIKSLGSDGNYLTHPTTFKHCRSLYQPSLFTRDDYQKWESKGAFNVARKAHTLLSERLASYEKPPIDHEIEKRLVQYVERQKISLLDKKFVF